MNHLKIISGIVSLAAFSLSAAGQAEVAVVASSNGTIRADGPTSSPWFHNAQIAGDFASYAISSFVLTADQFGEGEVTSIDSVTISYTQANAGFTTDGPVGFHITFDPTVGAGDYSGLTHDGSAAGVDDTQFSDAPVSQAVFSGTFTEMESGTVDTFPLDVSGVEAHLLAAINAGEPFSVILIAPGTEGAVTYAGIENNSYPDSIILNVTASMGTGDGEVITLFQDAADLAGLVVTNSTNSDTVLVDGSTTPVSALDGDALRQFDFDDGGRTTLRYTPDNATNAGVQYSFDVYIDPTSSGINIMRVGNDLASMAGIKGSGVSVVIDSNGDIKADVADMTSGTGRSQEIYAAAATPGTPFNLSVVFNAATEGDLSFSLGGSELTLAPQTFAVFVDDMLLGTDLAALGAASTGDATYTYDPAAGAQDVWWFSGGASSQTGMDVQFDNIVVKTGSEIGDGPPVVVETALMITGVLDGPLSGGTPKVIELYALADIPDLSIYGIGSANNGGGTDGIELTLEGSASAGDFIWIASEDVEFANVFGFAPDYVTGAAAINGDDAIELFLNGTVVDVFGEIDVDGNGTPWEYLDGWAYRNSESMADGTFVLTDWTFSGPDALDDLDAAGVAAAVPFGTYVAEVVVEPDLLPWEAEGLETGDFVVSPWFGGFEVGTDDWLFHTELGWIYVGLVESSDSMWLYSYYWDTWLWSGEDLFPVVYATGSNAWLYYFIVEDVGAFVFDYATSSWSLNP